MRKVLIHRGLPARITWNSFGKDLQQLTSPLRREDPTDDDTDRLAAKFLRLSTYSQRGVAKCYSSDRWDQDQRVWSNSHLKSEYYQDWSNYS